MFHILNGDAVATPFVKSGIAGEFAIWRELHCQGPTVLQISTEEFSDKRKLFLKSYLDIDQDFFDEHTQSQLALISGQIEKEVTLWFEYDLFCQINMMVAINLLEQINPDCTIYLITVGKSLEHSDWITLAQVTPEEWPQLYQHKRFLDENAIHFMKMAWKIYCSNDHRDFDTLLADCPPAYKYFPQAIENHFRRFPSRMDLLTDIQRFIFQNLSKNEFTRENLLIRLLLKHFHFYGYGDLQYQAILKSLQHFIELTSEGYRLKKPFVGQIEASDCQYLPTMIYGGQSNKSRFTEDFIAPEF
ncbi:MAG: hypothetical protein IPL46_31820 [Saprospiraceae bacterium]|nr:hypothetical protein [Saprospiraceae bacterium]